jgi:acetoin utilization deacetylase AcuC-like enzyme
MAAKLCDKLVPPRAAQQATFDTIDAYNLFREVRRIDPQMSPRTKMEEFHSKEFVDSLEMLDQRDQRLRRRDDFNEETMEEHGLVLRNSFNGGWKYCRLVTGATLVGTNELLAGTATLAINYMGGKSRAGPNSMIGESSYVNDTALALFGLRKRFKRIAVVDLSATHPQSLQDAFYFSGNVFTVSIHRYEKSDTTYGSGRRKEKGAEGEGRHTNLNVNMSPGANDENLMSVVREVAHGLSDEYQPDCVVMTVGTSGIAGGRSKLMYTPLGVSAAVEHLLKALDVPTLLLGGDDEWYPTGGGEAACGTHARMWTLIVDAAVNATKGVVSTLPNDIPDEDNESWRLMGPSFELREGDGDEEEEKEEEAGRCNENYVDMDVKIAGIRERFRKYRRCHQSSSSSSVVPAG